MHAVASIAHSAHVNMKAHLAAEKCIWGPHLIVVPTSTLLNWEMELKKWCPSFKVSARVRGRGRGHGQGWGWVRVRAGDSG